MTWLRPLSAAQSAASAAELQRNFTFGLCTPIDPNKTKVPMWSPIDHGVQAHTEVLTSLRNGNNRVLMDIVEGNKLPMILGIVKFGKYRMEIGGVLFEISVNREHLSMGVEVTLTESVLDRRVSRVIGDDDAALVSGGLDAAVSRAFAEMLTELVVFVRLQEI